jgi:uncharacterized protein YlxW (UPF0749 family)
MLKTIWTTSTWSETHSKMKLEVTKTNQILAAVILLLLGYIIVTSTTSNVSVKDPVYENKIDSLNRAIADYQKQQLVLDGKISKYELDIKKLDNEIDSTKQVIIDQRKYYGNKIKNAGKYTATELDTFFTNRYK